MDKEKKQNQTQFDLIMEKTGDFGYFQILHACLLLAATIPCGMFVLGNVFLAGVPEYWCVSGVYNKSNLTDSHNSNVTLPPYNQAESNGNIYELNSSKVTTVQHGNSVNSKSRFTWSGCPDLSNGSYSNGDFCDKWEFDTTHYGSTVVTEWNLVCSSEWMASLSQTTYMVGFLLGGIWVGAISDRIGRKKSWLINILLMTVTGCIASFMPTYWAFMALRLLSSMGSTAMFISGFVLYTEVIPERHRLPCGVLFQLPFAFGYMIMSCVAYFVKDFRHLTLFIGLCPVLFIPCYWFIDESLRWLIAKGRVDDAMNVIKRICRLNKTEYTEEWFRKEVEMIVKSGNSKENKKASVSLLDLVRTPNMRFRTFGTCCGWMTVNLVFYGLTMGSVDLVGGPHLNLFLCGFMEFPFNLLFGFWLMKKIGVKWSLTSCLFITAVCCMLIVVIPADYQIIKTSLSLTGMLVISPAFASIYMYTAELFPTVIRSIAVGVGSTCARISGILSPNIALLGKQWMPLPYLIFGSCTIISALVTLTLPDTFHEDLLETIDDVENSDRNGTMCENLMDFPCRNASAKSKEYKMSAQNNNNNENGVLRPLV